MKALFDRQSLLHAVQIACSIVPARTPKVILQNVKLSVSKKLATVKATDLESVGITMEVRGVQIEEPGDILLPSGRIVQILKECGDEEVKIEADNDGTAIRWQFSEFELPGENADAYPTVNGFDAESYHTITAGTLKEMTSRTIFAAASESARYALTGVLWECGADNSIRLVATSGISQGNISDYERGVLANPSLDILLKLSAAYGTTVSKLTRGLGQPETKGE